MCSSNLQQFSSRYTRADRSSVFISERKTWPNNCHIEEDSFPLKTLFWVLWKPLDGLFVCLFLNSQKPLWKEKLELLLDIHDFLFILPTSWHLQSSWALRLRLWYKNTWPLLLRGCHSEHGSHSCGLTVCLPHHSRSQTHVMASPGITG